MAAVNVVIGDRTYQIGKMSAQDQFHVFRRVMPLLKPIMETIKRGRKDLKEGEDLDIRQILQAGVVAAISDDLANIPDEQLNYVIDKCLSVTSLVQSGAVVPIMVNGRSMFQAMDMPTMIQIMWAVLLENFRPFLVGALAGQLNGGAATQGTSSNS